MAAAAAAAWALTLAVFWPGYALYDSVAQYRQALGGVYDDWHPPAMAHLWALFVAAGATGAGPMLVLQAGLYWLGLGLLAAALARGGRRRAAWAVLAIGAWPPLLGWQVVVLKDTQMLGALVAATGIVAWWRLRGARVPVAAALLVAVLIAYATLVRANAMFASVPLAIGLLGWPRSPVARGAAAVAAIGLVVAGAPPVNHRLIGAEPSGVEKTLPMYDLAAIGVVTDDTRATGLSPAAIGTIRARHCVSAFFWDPLGTPGHCDETMQELRVRPAGALYPLWVGAIVRHPLAYAAQRLGHWNSTERWLVAYRWPTAAPPEGGEVNDIGLGSPGTAARAWQRLAGWLVETPLGWPIVWAAVAPMLLAASSGRGASPTLSLARTLLVSALTLEASFVVLSIASDLRYHLWPMTATALAAVLLADGGGWRRRPAWSGAVVLALVLAGGIAARVVLPVPPQSYAGMLG